MAVLALLTAARGLDAVGVSRVLTTQLGSRPFEAVADQWLLPALTRVGDAWRDGELGVEGEHLISNQVRNQLGAMLDGLTPVEGSPLLLLGLLPANHHELGLLCFTVAAAQRGMNTCYLGADAPLTAWARAIQTLAPAAVVTTASSERDLAPLQTLAELVPSQPEPLICVGGSLQDRSPDQCLRLGHQIGQAVASLAEIVGH